MTHADSGKWLKWEEDLRDSLKATIAVLTAAEKVDGNVAVKTWDWLHSESTTCPPWVNADNSRAIRLLLAALPARSSEASHE